MLRLPAIGTASLSVMLLNFAYVLRRLLDEIGFSSPTAIGLFPLFSAGVRRQKSDDLSEKDGM